jgi:hypothetical protein
MAIIVRPPILAMLDVEMSGAGTFAGSDVAMVAVSEPPVPAAGGMTISPAATPDVVSRSMVVGVLPTVIVSDVLPVGVGEGAGVGVAVAVGPPEGGVEVPPPPPPPHAVSKETSTTQAANFRTMTVLTHR